MHRVTLAVLALALAACSSSPASPSPTTAPASTATSPASSPATSPTSSGPCVDVGALADAGDPVVNALTGVVTALKIADTAQASTLATTASAGMRALADLVANAKPEAATAFRAVADALDTAAKAFPAGQSTVEQLQTDLEAAFALARTAACPS
jgi:hypothetical protein